MSSRWMRVCLLTGPGCWPQDPPTPARLPLGPLLDQPVLWRLTGSIYFTASDLPQNRGEEPPSSLPRSLHLEGTAPQLKL